MLKPLLLSLALLPLPAVAGPVNFDASWREQSFFRLTANDYRPSGKGLQVMSNKGVSIFYSGLPEGQWGARKASWNWVVDQTVPPTDLAIKGGDDRNLALYFVFMDPESARKAGPRPKLTKLLGNKEARMLVYVWGGKHKRGQVLASPYLDSRGKTLILRPSGTGGFMENVDLAGDYARAFGGAPQALVGVAVSADSDDTASVIRGRIEDLRLE